MKYPLHFVLILLLLPLQILIGCASEEKKADTPEAVFAIAQEYEKDERYEEAVKKYTEVKNKFPYSSMALKAELAIADVYYKQESFAEAQVSYVTFRELHPKHPQIDYVLFRIGMSYYNQLPETIDRDLTLANEAINYFNEIITQHSSSQYVVESKEKRDLSLKKLAEKEEYIGDFYFKRDQCASAIPRYENLVKKFPGRGLDSKALSRLVICSKKINDDGKAQKYFQVLKEKFSETSDFADARKAMN